MTNWVRSIRERAPQIKENIIPAGKEDSLIIFAIILVGISAFGLGRLSSSVEERPAVTLVRYSQTDQVPMRIGGKLVASRMGSKYHYPWCFGARTMKEENKIWFDSEDEARKAGYTPAGNCKGLR